jgi:hypothetical protein
VRRDRDGEIEVNEYPLTLDDITSWCRSKKNMLAGSGVTLVDIKERTEYLPAVAADFDGIGSMGRINAWLSGDFDFEAISVSDGKCLFSKHVRISTLEALETTYSEFLQHLVDPDK